MCNRRVFVLLAGMGFATMCWAQAPQLPPGPMQQKVSTTCTECHDANIIVQQRLSQKGWTKEVDKMTKWGALVEPGERDAFIEYLSTNFGPNNTFVPRQNPPAEDIKGSSSSGKRTGK